VLSIRVDALSVLTICRLRSAVQKFEIGENLGIPPFVTLLPGHFGLWTHGNDNYAIF